MINSIKEPLEAGERYELPNRKYMAAFSAQRTDGSPVNNPRYIKWAAKFMVDDKIVKTKDLQPCKQEDMNKFFPAENQMTQQ